MSEYEVAPTAGFEPTTDRLTADCSTAELCRNLSVPLSRNMRILTLAFVLVKPLKANNYKKSCVVYLMLNF